MFLFLIRVILNIETATPQNGRTHSNNLLVVADKLFECDPFMGLGLKGQIPRDFQAVAIPFYVVFILLRVRYK